MSKSLKPKVATINEVATKGGTATFKKHGKKHYKKMADIRWGNKVAPKRAGK